MSGDVDLCIILQLFHGLVARPLCYVFAWTASIQSSFDGSLSKRVVGFVAMDSSRLTSSLDQAADRVDTQRATLEPYEIVS